MNKITALITIISFVFSTSAMAKSHVFKYKQTEEITKSHKFAKYTGYSILGIVASFALHGFKNIGAKGNQSIDTNLGKLLGTTMNYKAVDNALILLVYSFFANSMASLGLLGTGGLYGIVGTFKGLEEVDVKAMKKYARVMKAQLKANATTGLIPYNQEVVKVLNSFKCVSCESVQDKSKKLLEIVAKSDVLAEKIMAKDDLSKRELEKMVEKSQFNEQVEEILGEDAGSENETIGLQILVLSLMSYL